MRPPCIARVWVGLKFLLTRTNTVVLLVMEFNNYYYYTVCCLQVPDLKTKDGYKRPSQRKAITQPYQIQMGLAAFKFLLLFWEYDEQSWLYCDENCMGWCRFFIHTSLYKSYSKNLLRKWLKCISFDWFQITRPTFYWFLLVDFEIRLTNLYTA